MPRTDTVAPAALSIPSCAKTLGISRDTVYRLVRERKLRLVKLGTRTVIPVAEVDRLLAPPANDNSASPTSDVVRKAA